MCDQKNLGQIFFGSTIFWVQNIFGSESILGLKLFWSSSTNVCFPLNVLKVVFHQRLSWTQGCLPSKVKSLQRSSSTLYLPCIDLFLTLPWLWLEVNQTKVCGSGGKGWPLFLWLTSTWVALSWVELIVELRAFGDDDTRRGGAIRRTRDVCNHDASGVCSLHGPGAKKRFKPVHWGWTSQNQMGSPLLYD